MLTKKDYRDAIEVQNAVNLSGVVHSFNSVLSKIWDEVHENKIVNATEYISNHPISVLYAWKIASLSRLLRCEDFAAFSKAYDQCLKMSDSCPVE